MTLTRADSVGQFHLFKTMSYLCASSLLLVLLVPPTATQCPNGACPWLQDQADPTKGVEVRTRRGWDHSDPRRWMLGDDTWLKGEEEEVRRLKDDDQLAYQPIKGEDSVLDIDRGSQKGFSSDRGRSGRLLSWKGDEKGPGDWNYGKKRFPHNILRFGKRGNFLRFGKRWNTLRFGKRGNILRFGKRTPFELDGPEEIVRQKLLSLLKGQGSFN